MEEKFQIDKTFIEDSFPVREVSYEGAKEKILGMGIYLPCIYGGQGVHW